MRYTWVLFDADGTLFDYDLAEAKALKKTIEGMGTVFVPEYRAIYRRINAQMWIDFEKGLVTPDQIKVDRFVQFFDEVGLQADPVEVGQRYLAHLAEGTDLVEGAHEVVAALRGVVGLLLITNGLTRVQRPRFSASVLHDSFDQIVISEEVGCSKPGSDIFDVAFERMGQPRKEDVLIVGDSLSSDMKGGHDYGIDTCWFNPGRRPQPKDLSTTFEIQHLRQVLPIIRGLPLPS